MKEPLHSDSIPVEDMRCINAICTSLGGCTMYKVDGPCDLVDYGINDFAGRPIVTEELLNVAAKKFSVYLEKSKGLMLHAMRRLMRINYEME